MWSEGDVVAQVLVRTRSFIRGLQLAVQKLTLDKPFGGQP